MAHSKRNTSRAVFTSYERAEARKAWGSTSARLTRESFLPFASCRLCLEPAIDPVSCTHGDLFCRECALNNILAQKKEIKRLEKARELEERDNDEAEGHKDAEARERAVREFEMTQNGLDVKHASRTNGRSRRPQADTFDTDAPHAQEERSAPKRKFEMDDDEFLRIATADRAKARKALDTEKDSKPKLPSFWTPSITPSSNTNTELHSISKKTKTAPECPSSDPAKPHAYSLHTLTPVHFTEDDEPDGNNNTKRRPSRICPACKRALSNASKPTLAKPCGHVLCGACVDKFVRPMGHSDPHAEEAPDPEGGLRCYVCDADLVDKSAEAGNKKKDRERIRPGLVELRSEGTGFSAGGNSQISKPGTAFAC